MAATWSTVVEALEHPQGAVLRLRYELDHVEDPDRRWVVRVALEEALDRQGPEAVDELARLTGEMDEAGADAEIRVWVRALLAERRAARFDPASIPLAHEALALLPDESRLTSVGILARARLHRLLAELWLVVPGDNAAVSQRHHDQAMRDLERCGLAAQAAWTSLLHAGLQIVLVGADPLHGLGRMEEALAVLDERVSGLRVAGAAVVAVAAALVGRREVFGAAVDRVEAGRDQPPLLIWDRPQVDLILRILRVFGDLVLGEPGPTATGRLDAVIEEARRRDPWLCVLVLHGGTVALADLGDLDGARHLWARARAYPLPFVPMAESTPIIPLRLRLLGGDPSAVAPFKDELNAMVTTGRARLAANQALRAAVDCRRAGDHDHADLLLSFALEHLGPPDRWAPAEAERATRAASVDESRAGQAPALPGVRIRLLVPRVLVDIDDRPVTLTNGVARLLAVLLAHPSSFTVDQLIERLWPDSDAGAARRRLASALHRLRSTLGAGRHELVVRHGDALTVVVPPHWRVDLLDFRAALRGGDDRTVSDALRSVTGVLGSAQFAYDEALADDRHELVATWVAAARDLCRRGVIGADDLARPLAALDLGPDDVVYS